ncbi:MAG: hypothetical protein HQM15_01765 [Deltaproteobacteria bacterium]|nr:hypothetical protein [Deltaproteobacteria bacterium]
MSLKWAFGFAGMVFLLLSSVSYSQNTYQNLKIIHLKGAEIPEFLNQDVRQMKVLRFEKQGWKVIPFQIDEKMDGPASSPASKNRKWALGEVFSRRTESSVGNLKLEADEEILWMAQDMGEKASSKACDKMAEVQLEGRYSYICFSEKMPNFAEDKKNYVSYLPNEDKVDALGYESRFDVKYPLVQNELIPKNSIASANQNIIDRFKVRFLLALKKFFDVTVTEENVTVKKIGYKAGPIRIIRRLIIYKSLGPIRVSPKIESDFFFYPYNILIPSEMSNPLDGPKSLAENSIGFSGLDFSHSFQGTQFYTNTQTKAVTFDGQMSEEEKNLNGQEVSWWVASGKQGTILVKTDWDPALTKAGVKAEMIYRDDWSKADPPENEQGETLIGFQMNLSKMPAGRYHITSNQIFPPSSFKKGEENILLKAFQNPQLVIQMLP